MAAFDTTGALGLASASSTALRTSPLLPRAATRAAMHRGDDGHRSATLSVSATSPWAAHRRAT